MVTMVPFGIDSKGEKIYRFLITDTSGNCAVVLNYGATLQQLWIDGREVCLGYDTLSEYEKSSSCFGGTMGRCTGRIADRKVILSGKTWYLSENRENLHMHGGFTGFHKRAWEWEIVDAGVCFTYHSSHKEEGYPGNLLIHVTYRWSVTGVLELEYDGVSDRETVINLTNHSYFNLNGQAEGNAMEQRLQILSKQVAVTRTGNIPTGEVQDVDGTALDFLTPHTVGERIEDVTLQKTGGYDHCYILQGGVLNLSARLWSQTGDMRMDVWTDLPALGLYTANGLQRQKGMGNCCYAPRSGVCLETQYIPNGANLPGFTPTPIFQRGERYHHITRFCFYYDDINGKDAL